MEQFLPIIMWVVMLLGVTGAYAMTLSIMLVVTANQNRTLYFVFIFPGMIYIMTYSFLGFLWGLQFWNLFSKEGPIHSVIGSWKENPADCAISTVVFVIVWLMLGYLTNNITW